MACSTLSAVWNVQPSSLISDKPRAGPSILTLMLYCEVAFGSEYLFRCQTSSVHAPASAPTSCDTGKWMTLSSPASPLATGNYRLQNKVAVKVWLSIRLVPWFSLLHKRENCSFKQYHRLAGFRTQEVMFPEKITGNFSTSSHQIVSFWPIKLEFLRHFEENHRACGSVWGELPCELTLKNFGWV